MLIVLESNSKNQCEVLRRNGFGVISVTKPTILYSKKGDGRGVQIHLIPGHLQRYPPICWVPNTNSTCRLAGTYSQSGNKHQFYLHLALLFLLCSFRPWQNEHSLRQVGERLLNSIWLRLGLSADHDKKKTWNGCRCHKRTFFARRPFVCWIGIIFRWQVTGWPSLQTGKVKV